MVLIRDTPQSKSYAETEQMLENYTTKIRIGRVLVKQY